MADNFDNYAQNDATNAKTGFIGRVGNFYRRHPVLSNFLLICLSGFVLLYSAFIFFDIFTNHGATTTVPSIKGRTYAEAMSLVDASDLNIEIADSIYDEVLPPGTVKELWPNAGATVKPGTTVFVTVTSFQPQIVTIKDPLVGVSSRQALSSLAKNKIRDVRIVHVPDQFADLVVKALYKGKEVHPGMKIPVNATITLEVGSGWNSDIDGDPEAADEEYMETEDAIMTEFVESATATRAAEPVKNQHHSAPSEPVKNEHHSAPSEPETNPDIFN